MAVSQRLIAGEKFEQILGEPGMHSPASARRWRMGAMMKQREVFLQSEGDAWFARNQAVLANVDLPRDDALLRELIDILPQEQPSRPWDVLEIGCGDARRLSWIQQHLPAVCRGLEPSARGVAAGRERGVAVERGTADALPFSDASADVVMFGFCLYLCDREDLFRIAAEADRVLRSPGWLLLFDFFSPVPRANPYHHRLGVKSYKMDYRTLFLWHPDYECMTHKVRDQSGRLVDDPGEWTGISVLSKRQR